MHSFVYGNQSQAVSISVPFAPQPKNYSFQQSHTSLFDRYNRGNLYLRDCQERDLNVLGRNIVVHQEGISGYGLSYFQGIGLEYCQKECGEDEDSANL